jgi:hypothetical protein
VGADLLRSVTFRSERPSETIGWLREGKVFAFSTKLFDAVVVTFEHFATD